jgi:hypothetical protein
LSRKNPVLLKNPGFAYRGSGDSGAKRGRRQPRFRRKSFSASGAGRIRLHVFRSEQTDATTSLPINYYQATGALDRRSKHVLILDIRLFKFDHAT